MPFYNIILFLFLLSTSFFLLLIIPFPWNVSVFTVCLLTDITIIWGRIKNIKANEIADKRDGDPEN